MTVEKWHWHVIIIITMHVVIIMTFDVLNFTLKKHANNWNPNSIHDINPGYACTQLRPYSTCRWFNLPGFSAVSEEEMSRVLRADQLPPCNEDQLMMFLAEIQAINPERIINSATMEELDPLCRCDV